MRLSRLMAVLLSLGLIVAGCGWSPPSASPPQPDTCWPADGPGADNVTAAISSLPQPPSARWEETARGHTVNCRLYWVQVSQPGAAPDSTQQVLFFDRTVFVGTPTPDPRPYITVLTSGDSVTVQYQWRQGNDSPTSPTGIGTVRFQIGEDGKLKPLDPIPDP